MKNLELMEHMKMLRHDLQQQVCARSVTMAVLRFDRWFAVEAEAPDADAAA
jgi:hypothetical protein